jgi:hypothetical protein
MAHFWVNGIVAARDKQPYIQLSNEKGMIAQLSMGEARQIALDILMQSARTEMDAMVLKFVEKMKLPENAGAMMMSEFREFRATVDDERIEHTHREANDDDEP